MRFCLFFCSCHFNSFSPLHEQLLKLKNASKRLHVIDSVRLNLLLVLPNAKRESLDFFLVQLLLILLADFSLLAAGEDILREEVEL